MVEGGRVVQINGTQSRGCGNGAKGLVNGCEGERVELGVQVNSLNPMRSRNYICVARWVLFMPIYLKYESILMGWLALNKVHPLLVQKSTTHPNLNSLTKDQEVSGGEQRVRDQTLCVKCALQVNTYNVSQWLQQKWIMWFRLVQLGSMRTLAPRYILHSATNWPLNRTGLTFFGAAVTTIWHVLHPGSGKTNLPAFC